MIFQLISQISVPTTKARRLCALMLAASLALAALAFIFAPDLISSGSEEIWYPTMSANGAMGHQWGGYEAVYNGNPWYYGIFPSLVALAITLFASLGVASHFKLIDWKETKPLAQAE